MLERVTAQEYVRPSRNGRTRPLLLVCTNAAGDEVELYAKVSARCDEGAVNLAREAIAACLAGDLGLPVLQPYLVELPAVWIASVPDAALRADLTASSPVAFGSRVAGPQFGAWHGGVTLHDDMVAKALAIFTFDAIIQNYDRRAENPNCLERGTQLRVIDHELAFMHRLILGWRPPWTPGALEGLTVPGRHIFLAGLRKQNLDFAPVRAAWSTLSDGRIDLYAASLPTVWAKAASDATDAIRLIKDARDNIDACLTEIQRVLT